MLRYVALVAGTAALAIIFLGTLTNLRFGWFGIVLRSTRAAASANGTVAGAGAGLGPDAGAAIGGGIASAGTVSGTTTRTAPLAGAGASVGRGEQTFVANASWSRALDSQFGSLPLGVYADKNKVLDYFSKYNKLWQWVLVVIDHGKINIEHSHRKVHMNRFNWTSIMLRRLHEVEPLPDMAFLVSLNDCVPTFSAKATIKIQFPHFGTVFMKGHKQISLPVTLGNYWVGGADIEAYDWIPHARRTLKQYRRYAAKIPWEQKDSPVFYRGSRNKPWRNFLFEMGKKRPDLYNVTPSFVERDEFFGLHRSFFYVPGFCGWSGTLLQIVHGGGVIFFFTGGSLGYEYNQPSVHWFAELALDPGVDYVPLSKRNSTAVIEKLLSDTDRLQSLRRNLRRKAATLLTPEGVNDYVRQALLRYYHDHYRS